MVSENALKAVPLATDVGEAYPHEIILFGRLLGTGRFDEDDEAVDDFGYYNFIPASGVPLQPGYLSINMTTGVVRVCQDDGNGHAWSLPCDIIEILNGLPKLRSIYDNDG